MGEGMGREAKGWESKEREERSKGGEERKRSLKANSKRSEY